MGFTTMENYIKVINGKLYKGHRFITSAQSALGRLLVKNELNTDIQFMKNLLEVMPEKTLLELDVSEIIDNQDMYNPISIQHIFSQMDAVRRA